MNEETKPSSNTVLLFIGVILLLAVSVLLPSSFFGAKQIKEEPIDFSKLQTTETFTKTKDNNNDGNVTWGELLGESFIRDTQTEQGEQPNKEVLALLNDPNNVTATFAKNLAVSSVYLRDNNVTDADAQKQMMDSVLEEAISKTVSRQYLPSDLKIAKSESKESIKAYGNTVGDMLQTLITSKNLSEDVPGLGMYLEKKDESYLKPLIADAVRVDGVTKKLLAVEVPPSAVIYHLIMLNQVVLYSDNLKNLASVIKDPMRSAASIEKYPDIMVNTLKTYKTMSNYFSTKNIVFKQNEGGYLFTVGFTLE